MPRSAPVACACLAGLAALLLPGCADEAPAPVRRTVTAETGAEAASAERAESGAIAGSVAGTAPPRIDSLRLDPEAPTTGTSVRALVEVSDPDGDHVWVDYAWTIGGEPYEGSTPRVLLRGVPKGTPIELVVTARDGKSASASEELSAVVANAPPVLGRIQVHASETLTVGEPVLLQPEATDADGDPIQFRYRWEVNGVLQGEDGESFDTSRLSRGDTVQATVVASDGRAQSEARELPALSVGNAPPRILSTPGEDFGSGDSFYQVRAEDPDGQGPLAYSLENAPEGMTIDPQSGAIRWTPTLEQAGTHSLAVVVSDVQGGRSRQAIEVTVGGPAADAEAPPARRR